MTSRERLLALFAGKPVDHLALMPITMMFAADQIGARYGEYARDHRVLAEAQIFTARKFGFDFVSAISDPAREPAEFLNPARFEAEDVIHKPDMIGTDIPPQPL